MDSLHVVAGPEPTPTLTLPYDIVVAGNIGMDFNFRGFFDPLNIASYREDHPLVLRSVDDWQNPLIAKHVPLPGQERIYTYTAAEICKGFPHTLNASVDLQRINRTHAWVGVDLGVLSSSKDKEVETTWVVYPSELAGADQELSFEFQSLMKPPISARLSATARRLPSLEGGYTEWPSCPQKQNQGG
jgi:hypothetical protein